MMDRYDGDMVEVAEELGIKVGTVLHRINAAVEGDPLWRFNRIMSLDERTLAASLKRHNGDRLKAAKELGVPPEIVYRRIRDAESWSPLARFQKRRGDATDVTKTGSGDK